MTDLTYKCHTLTINELLNFKNPAEKLYRKVAANMQADFEEYILMN